MCPPNAPPNSKLKRNLVATISTIHRVCFRRTTFVTKIQWVGRGILPFAHLESSRASKVLVTMLGSVIFLLRTLQCLIFLRLFWQSNLGKYISTWNLKYLFYRNGCCNWMIKHLFYRNGFCNWMIKHLYLGSTWFLPSSIHLKLLGFGTYDFPETLNYQFQMDGWWFPIHFLFVKIWGFPSSHWNLAICVFHGFRSSGSER